MILFVNYSLYITTLLPLALISYFQWFVCICEICPKGKWVCLISMAGLRVFVFRGISVSKVKKRKIIMNEPTILDYNWSQMSV